MLFPILSLEQHAKQHHHLVVLFCITRSNSKAVRGAVLCIAQAYQFSEYQMPEVLEMPEMPERTLLMRRSPV